MNVVTGISKLEPVTAPFMHRIHRLHRIHRKGFTVEGPLVEAIQRAVVLDDRHLDHLVGSGWRSIWLTETRIIPAERFGFDPLRLTTRGFPGRFESVGFP